MLDGFLARGKKGQGFTFPNGPIRLHSWLPHSILGAKMAQQQPLTKQNTAQDTALHASWLKRRTRQRRGVGMGSVILLLFLAYGYFIPRGALWNPDTHIYLAASIVDRGQLNIDPYAPYTGDKAAYNGHYYSDKAPGASLLAVPVYAFVKLTLYQGKTPYLQLLSASDAERTDFLPRYLMTLLVVGLPAALLGGLIFRFLAYLGLGPGGRVVLALGYGLGTIAFAFSTVFFSHQIAALLLFAAFYILFRIRRGTLSQRYYLAAGVLAGYAIITEYPTALIVGCLALYAFFPARNWRALLLMGAGALPSLIIAAVYNTLCFGAPWNQGYANLAGPEAFRVGQAQGFLGITYPHLDAVWQMTFGPYRGLFLLSPFLLLAVPGFVLLFRQRAAWRSEAILWLGIVAVYFFFAMSYFAWDGGYSLGPRHFIPALPFLVLPIALMLKQRGWLRRLTVALIALSVLIVTLATAVFPLNDPRFDSPLSQRVLPLLLGMQPDPLHPALPVASLWSALWREAPLFPHAQLDNNWGELFRLPGIWQLLPLLLCAGLILLRFWRRAGPPAPELTRRPAHAAEDQQARDQGAAPATDERAYPYSPPRSDYPAATEPTKLPPE
jgi:hypothetical protein